MAGWRILVLGIVVTIAAVRTAGANPMAWPPATGWPGSTVDAYINLGSGTYPDQNQITTGNAQPWYDSAAVARLFGGTPTAQQQQAFDAAVLQHVEQTFNLSGIPLSVTDTAGQQTEHTLSVVSNTTSMAYPGSIGTTIIGGNGFSFIEPMAQSAQSVSQLEWLVAHNISHELMLAFGVGENYDQTGNYIDASRANFAMMVNPYSTFSPAAAAALRAAVPPSETNRIIQSAPQIVLPTATPEPATWTLWGLAAAAMVWRRCRRPARAAA